MHTEPETIRHLRLFELLWQETRAEETALRLRNGGEVTGNQRNFEIVRARALHSWAQPQAADAGTAKISAAKPGRYNELFRAVRP